MEFPNFFIVSYFLFCIPFILQFSNQMASSIIFVQYNKTVEPNISTKGKNKPQKVGSEKDGLCF